MENKIKKIFGEFYPDPSDLDVADGLGRHILLANFLAKVFTIGLSPVLIYLLFRGEFKAVSLIFCLQLICLLTIYLNSKEYFFISRLNLLLTLNLGGIPVSFYIGPDSPLTLSYIAIIVVPVLIFEPSRKKLRLFGILLTFTCMAFSRWSGIDLRSEPSDAATAEHVFDILVPILLFVIVTLEIYYIDRLNRAFENRMQRITDQLNQQIQDNLRMAEERDYERLKMVQTSKLADLGELAGNIAHEINNPLGILLMHLGLLEKNLKKGEEIDIKKLEKSVSVSKETLKRIERIVQGLRKVCRGENDDMRPELVELDELIFETISLCKERFKNQGIELQFNSSINSNRIMINATALSQAILNLLTNAMHAIEKLEDPKWVRIECYETDLNVLISITDSGKGISPEIRDKIMLPFYTTKGQDKGTGLGLSISKKNIESMGGQLNLDTACLNTKFTIEIPKDVRQQVKNSA